MAVLVAKSGPDAGSRYKLFGKNSILGRLSDCDIVVDGSSVSRHHAEIVHLGNEYFLEDLGSRNGTYLNDQRIDRRWQLKDGDTVQVCDFAFAFHEDDADAARRSDGSGFAPVIVDDEPQLTQSTIMPIADVSPKSGSAELSTSAAAKFDALLKIIQSLGKALLPDKVLPQVLNSLFKIFAQADHGFIVLKGERGELVPRWTKVRDEDSDQSLHISRTVANQVIGSKEAILSADAASDSRFEMSESIADFRIRSMMCAPLIDSDGEAFGVLQVDTLDQHHRFEVADLEVLAAVASQAGIAIDNAQLHEKALRQREVERDLELAKQVQRGFLPQHPPQVHGYRFFDYYQPANKVGGDYYDYVELPDGRIAVIVADVVGHGVAAALLMAKLSSEVRFCLAADSQPGAALSRLNDILARGGLEDRFITLVLAVLEPATHEVTIANAGHIAPMLRLGMQRVKDAGAEEAGMPLGIAENVRYRQHTFRLEPGQFLALFTDGINEAMNLKDELYSMDRLRRQVGADAESVESLGQGLIADVRRFTGERAQYDDMCLVCFGRE